MSLNNCKYIMYSIILKVRTFFLHSAKKYTMDYDSLGGELKCHDCRIRCLIVKRN